MSVNTISLSVHYRKTHHKTSRELYLDLFCEDGLPPLCSCGCKSPVKFHSINAGFSKFAPGHQARVSNNWGHNDVAQKKSQAVRSEMHKRGEIKIWNKGETKKTDDRIAAYGAEQSDNFTQERREIRSKRMTENRLSKVIQDLRGKDHGKWKGGVSALQPVCRSRLHERWVRPIMVRDKFTCQRCGKQNDLCVHHDKIRFAEILQIAMSNFQVSDATTMTFEQKDTLAEWVTEFHIKNNVSGITLCVDCHEIVHAEEKTRDFGV